MTGPTCVAAAPWPNDPPRRFCSLTCRRVDLGVWLDAGDRVPADTGGDVP